MHGLNVARQLAGAFASPLLAPGLSTRKRLKAVKLAGRPTIAKSAARKRLFARRRRAFPHGNSHSRVNAPNLFPRQHIGICPEPLTARSKKGRDPLSSSHQRHRLSRCFLTPLRVVFTPSGSLCSKHSGRRLTCLQIAPDPRSLPAARSRPQIIVPGPLRFRGLAVP